MSTLVQHAPRLAAETAAQLARDLYGLTADVESLPSERDQNFLLRTPGGTRYVLKVANAAESRAALELQNRAMEHVLRHWPACTDGQGEPSSSCPRPLLTMDGEEIAAFTAEDGRRHFIRLLTYLPGKPFALATPHDASLLERVGAYFGNLDRALAGFDHPAAHRYFHWDLAQASSVVRAHLADITDMRRRGLVEKLLHHFEQVAAPRLPDLPTQVIHNDGNDYNVLVRPDGRWGLQVGGVIDFGDMVYSARVNEPAIAAAYALLDQADPLAAAAHVVTGYHGTLPLSEPELAALFPLICMRLCVSVSLAAHQQRLEPGNEYLRISERPAWDALAQLAEVPPRFAHYALRAACGLSPCPQTATVAGWLRTQQDRFAPVVDAADLRDPTQIHVFDLSPGSLTLGALADPVDGAARDHLLAVELGASGARVGIGRHDEARLFVGAGLAPARLAPAQVDRDRTGRPQGSPLRVGDADSSSSVDGAGKPPELATIHLGVDLFLPSGAEIRAPLAGLVHGRQEANRTLVLAHQTDSGLPFYTCWRGLVPAIDGARVGESVTAGQAIGAVQAQDRLPRVHLQLAVDLLDADAGIPEFVPPSWRHVWTSLSPDPSLLLGVPTTCLPNLGRDKGEILAIREHHLGKSLSVSYRRPLKIVRGWRQFLYDEDGRAFLDGVNNVCHVGHCHPRVVAAGQRQMAVLNTNTRYLHDNIVEYAERLLSTLPDPLSVCFFVCSGSEANELALRLARTYTGRRDIITVDGAYHGNTQALIEISPYKFAGPGGAGAPPWVHTVAMPDGYRGPHKGQGRTAGEAYAEDVDRGLELAAAAGGAAAFICESLLGCGGQIVLPDGYLKAAFDRVRAAGGVCIADEVQVGFGRVGTHFWGFETQDVVPDIVTMGKPIGNGHPLAAVATTPEIADAFANGMEYFNTFGGNPVSCAIGLAVLDVVEQEGLQTHARAVGDRLLAGLRGLMDQHPLIGDVRGLGLFVGVELVLDRETLQPAPEHASHIANRMREHGILISTDGPLHNVLKLKPPLVFDEQDADRLAATLDTILSEDCVRM